MEELLTRPEIMKMLKVSYATVIRLEKRGLLKNVTPDGLRGARYLKSDVEKLIKGGKE